MALIADKTTADPVAASWANLIRNQSVQVTTSSLRPASPTEGMVIYETDTDAFSVYDGSGWRPFGRVGAFDTWTPTLAQSSAIAKTIHMARYTRFGRLYICQFDLAATATGTSGQAITITLPATARSLATSAQLPIGQAQGEGATTPANSLPLLPVIIAGNETLLGFIRSDQAHTGIYGSNDPSFAINSGFRISGTFMFEAA